MSIGESEALFYATSALAMCVLFLTTDIQSIWLMRPKRHWSASIVDQTHSS